MNGTAACGIVASRKAGWIAYLSMLGIVLGLFIVLYFQVAGGNDGQRFIGEQQLYILIADQQAQKFLFFVDLAAGLAVKHALLDLAAGGGYYGTSPCGEYYGYQVWQTVVPKDPANPDGGMEFKKCYPDSPHTAAALANFFGEYLRDITSQYPDKAATAQPLRHQLRITPAAVIGTAQDTVSFPILKEKSIPFDLTLAEDCSIGELAIIDPSLVACRAGKNCKLLPEVYERLLAAEQIAEQEGYHLIINSAYRSLEDQANFWEKGPPGHSNWAHNRRYVAPPECTSPHLTGRAVDIALKEVDMSGGKSGLSPEDMSVKPRQDLESIMLRAGFVRYKNEYWHYEYGSSMWKRMNGMVS